MVEAINPDDAANEALEAAIAGHEVNKKPGFEEVQKGPSESAKATIDMMIDNVASLTPEKLKEIGITSEMITNRAIERALSPGTLVVPSSELEAIGVDLDVYHAAIAENEQLVVEQFNTDRAEKMSEWTDLAKILSERLKNDENSDGFTGENGRLIAETLFMQLVEAGLIEQGNFQPSTEANYGDLQDLGGKITRVQEADGRFSDKRQLEYAEEQITFAEKALGI